MTNKTQPDKTDKSYSNALYPEDQKKVDEFITRGVNSVDRKPFRPLLLMIMLVAVVTSLSALSLILARSAGVY
jgi:hypothetical protein